MKVLFTAAGILAALIFPSAAHAQSRYVEPPPIIVSPDLAAPWVRQLRQAPEQSGHRYQQVAQTIRDREPWRAAPRRIERQPLFGRQRQVQVRVQPPAQIRMPARVQRPVQVQRPARVQMPRAPQQQLHTAAVAPRAPAAPERSMDPRFLPQVVDYDGSQKAGTIVIDTNQRFLFLVLPGGKAKRYGVGVGKEGFEWKGTEKISRKREWPDWRPPASMIARERKKGNILPVHMEGGPANPLGARALYLGSTLYRIHGTNAPWTIGGAVSSGCIRMRNEDVMDLYERVPVGTKVVVI